MTAGEWGMIDLAICLVALAIVFVHLRWQRALTRRVHRLADTDWEFKGPYGPKKLVDGSTGGDLLMSRRRNGRIEYREMTEQEAVEYRRRLRH